MKKVLLITLLVVILLTWFPSFGPADIISFYLITTLGISRYVLYSIAILIVAYLILPGNDLKAKWNTVKSTVRGLFK